MIFNFPQSQEPSHKSVRANVYAQMKRTRSYEDGFISKVYGLAMDGYDVAIPGRDVPYEQIRPTDREGSFVIGDKVRVGLVWSNNPLIPPVAFIIGRSDSNNPDPTLHGQDGTQITGKPPSSIGSGTGTTVPIAAWSMLGCDLARDRFAVGPTTIPTLLDSGLPSNCTQVILT